MSPEDVRMLVADLKELHQQVNFLQKDLESYRNIALILFSVLTVIGIERIWHFWSRIGTRVDAEVKRHAEKATQVITRVESDWRSLRSSLESSYIIKAGVRPIALVESNYVTQWEEFDAAFPSVPVVVLSEAIAGEWCYAKIDEVDVRRFKIALRTLGGRQISETRNIHWIAICPKPGIPPPGDVPVG